MPVYSPPVYHNSMKISEAARITSLLAVTLCFVLTAFLPSRAQERNYDFNLSSADPYESNRIYFPFLSYRPETSLMFGVLFTYQFKPKRAGTETRTSQLMSSGIYTLNNQVMFELEPIVIFPNETWIFDGRHEFKLFPENYWGIGPHARDRDEMDVDYVLWDFRQTVLRKIGAGLHAGPKLRFTHLSNVSFHNGNENGFSDSGDIRQLQSLSENNADSYVHTAPPGSDGSTLPGIGFSIRHDKRNSVVTPTEKHYLELTALFYPKFTGATHPHSSWMLDARRYVDLYDDRTSVLAFQFHSRLTHGRLPFQEYPVIGGNRKMRGYYEGRFRDNNAVQIQAEFRQHLYWRFGFSLFAGAGEVWNRFTRINPDNPKLAAGGGLRFDMNPDDTYNIRIDYGIGRHGSGIYITVGEAF